MPASGIHASNERDGGETSAGVAVVGLACGDSVPAADVGVGLAGVGLGVADLGVWLGVEFSGVRLGSVSVVTSTWALSSKSLICFSSS